MWKSTKNVSLTIFQLKICKMKLEVSLKFRAKTINFIKVKLWKWDFFKDFQTPWQTRKLSKIMQYGWRTGFSLLISGSTNKLRIYLIAHNYVVCKMSSTKWPQFRIFLIFQDRELQELRHIINNLKEKNEMGDQGKLWKRKKYYKVSKTFFFFFSAFKMEIRW